METPAPHELLSGVPATCPIPETHRCLGDAHRLWHDAADHYHDPDGFRRYLNSTIEALRSVTFRVQREKAAIPDFDTWYETWRGRMKVDPVLRWLNEARVEVFHRGDLETSSTARASILTWREHRLGEVPIPPFTPLAEFAVWLGAGLLPHLPTAARNEVVLVIERRWEVGDLPGQELLDALAHAYGLLDLLVTEAHQRCGAEFELFALDARGVRHVPTDHLGGRSPCMVTTRETRSVSVNMRTGSTYLPAQITPKRLPTDAEGEAAARRYKLHDVKPAASRDVFGFAETMGEVAKQMLRREGYLIPSVFLLRGGKLVQLSQLRFDDQQQKFLIWQRVADDVRRHGADGLVFISESWLLRDPRTMRGVRPSEAADREEAIHVFAAKSTGEVRSLVTPFSHGLFGKIKIEETREVGEVAVNFFTPVRDVWRGASPQGADAPTAAVGVPDAVGYPKPNS
jgi:hypothetical protein